MEMTEQQIDAIKNAEAPAQETGAEATPTVENQPDTAPECADSESADTLAALLAEAEERGYRRGREEALAQLVSEQGMWQPVGYAASPAGRMTRAADGFLSGLRPGVWER